MPRFGGAFFTVTEILSASCLSRIAANLARVLFTDARYWLGAIGWTMAQFPLQRLTKPERSYQG
jgi:hypothetical protein